MVEDLLISPNLWDRGDSRIRSSLFGNPKDLDVVPGHELFL